MRSILNHLYSIWGGLSLRVKLFIAIFFPTTTVLVAAFLIFSEYDAKNERLRMIGRTDAMIDALSQSWEDAYFLNSQGVASELSHQLDAFSEVRRVWLKDMDGNVRYSYSRAGLPPSRPPNATTDEGVSTSGDSLLLVRTLSIGDSPYGMLYAEVDRSQLIKNVRAHTLQWAAILFTMLVTLLFIVILTQHIATRPLMRLAQTAKRVAQTEDFAIRAKVNGSDEISQLAADFNTMMCHVHASQIYINDLNSKLEVRVKNRTSQLETANTKLQEEISAREEIQQQLMMASRQAGIAEMATSVLHNIGNVLNSVSVTANAIDEGLRTDRHKNLRRAVGMLQDHKGDLTRYVCDDSKGSQLLPYLLQLADHLDEQHETAQQDVHRLMASVSHAKQIVVSQQSMAKGQIVLETVGITDIVDSIVQMHHGTLEQHSIQLVRNIEKIPRILTDKHHLLQVLVNLVSNAIKAVQNVDARQRQITINASQCTEEDGRPVVYLEVADNGVGIEPERLSEIFTFGHTKWEKGAGSGFGLHSAGNTVKTLGGNLSVESDGLGKGARFILTIPISCQSEGVAA